MNPPSYKQYLNKANNSFRKLTSIIELDPYKNWVSLVILFSIINIFVISKSILEFYEIGSDEALISKETDNVVSGTINRGGLESVISAFDIKSENHKELKRNKPYFIDPSI